jgi:hypothetical protein
MIRRSPIESASARAVAVAGPDIDQSLLRTLEQGDKVTMEVNGVRIYNGNRCPIVSVEPWEVVSNDAPALGQRPTEDHKIVLSHPQIPTPIELHYTNLLLLPRRQPAVFLEHIKRFSCNKDGSVNPVYIVLQLISHYIPANQVNDYFEPYDLRSARLLLSNDEVRPVLMEQWAELFATFKKASWKQKSIFRMALRAFVLPAEIDAIVKHQFETLDMAAIYRIHEALHWLQFYVAQAPLAVQRDTWSGV